MMEKGFDAGSRFYVPWCGDWLGSSVALERAVSVVGSRVPVVRKARREGASAVPWRR